MSDHLQVSVQWKNASVFAGENVECTITFKNVSRPDRRRSPSPASRLRPYPAQRERWKGALPSHQRHHTASAITPRPSPVPTFPQATPPPYKPASSLGSPNGDVKHPSLPEPKLNTSKGQGSKDNKHHRRSLSIISIGGDVIDESPTKPSTLASGRPGIIHTRASSLQVLPRRNGLPSPASVSVPFSDRSFTSPSPTHRASASFVEPSSGVRGPPRPKLPTKPVPGLGIHGGVRERESPGQLSSFRFPQIAGSIGEIGAQSPRYPPPQPLNATSRALSPRPHGSFHGLEQPNPATRILSPGSINGTPRSSGEFYSMSNNSTETLASEYLPQESVRLMQRPPHSRQPSSLAPRRPPRSETLMMGFGQVAGSFTLDGSLVNQNPFEEVKRKGIIGARGGGGLVRMGSAKRDSGILGSFGWGSIGESFGGLLSDNGLSSIKEAKKSSGAKSIPILSTPQSILFVDLQLGPGEAKSYTFSHPLPKGIPPTHRGKAIKISYNLIVGTQMATRNAQQNQIQRVEIPFRVLTGVDENGEMLGHDLMSPHTILSNTATILSVDTSRRKEAPTARVPGGATSNSASGGLTSYVEKLLSKAPRSSASGLLSPTEEDSKSWPSMMQKPNTMRESIDLAILQSNTNTLARRSANRFEISRSGERVAIIMLARPAYRLGETISVAIDFQDSEVSCYALHATLESSETIDSSIALRSKASVQRVTRRIYASQHDSTISVERMLFNPVIPANVAPEFVTSKVNLEWKLRFEFVTSRPGELEGLGEDFDDLMEEVTGDDRGSVKAAVQGLPCEAFDVTVPLRVYGASTAFDENAESGDFPI